MKITEDIKYIGVDDRDIKLFEAQFVCKKGMAYNSYVVLDEKIAVLDTVEASFKDKWLNNLAEALRGRTPDYLIVQHMEPDHSANIAAFIEKYPTATVVASPRAFDLMQQFYGLNFGDDKIAVTEATNLSIGKHTLQFFNAPMVHWPEVIFTYDSYDKILFTADAFGKFGTTDANEEWTREARRYYFGIVGKFGAQVRAALKKIENLQINAICPLHGPALTENIPYYLNLYDIWSSYGVESDGVAVFYTSIYKNTEKAVLLLKDELENLGCKTTVVSNLVTDDMSEAVGNAFRYGKIVFASTTYNGGLFPVMKEFIQHLVERNFRNRVVGVVENGSWGVAAGRVMLQLLEGCKDLRFTDTTVKIKSAMTDENKADVKKLAEEILTAK